MRALYLANVGNRDVWVDGRPIPAEESRASGEKIPREYPSYRDRLSAPIIQAGLGYILGHGTEQNPVELRVCLFATNQDKSVGQHYHKDTVRLAEVLKRYLPERFPKTSASQIVDVRVVEIQENPSDYDAMYDFFGKQLRAKRVAPDDVDACFVSPVGGVPAANFALLLCAIERYAEKCYPIYVPEGSRHAEPTDVARQIRRGMLRSVARQELANYEFERAAALLRQVEAGEVLVGLAEHGRRRLHFDFHRATRALEDRVMPAARREDREFARRLRADLDGLLARDLAALIRELYCNLRVTYHGGRYVDFLLRLFRLQEAVLRLIVERELHLPTDAVKGGAHPDFVKGIEGDPGLRAHVQQPYGGKPLDYKRAPTLPVLRHLVAYHLATGGEAAQQCYGPAAAVLDRLEGLAELRNKSIGAHGFDGVSEEEIRRRYGADHDLQADLAEMVRRLGLDSGDSPFDRVRDFILARLG